MGGEEVEGEAASLPDPNAYQNAKLRQALAKPLNEHFTSTLFTGLAPKTIYPRICSGKWAGCREALLMSPEAGKLLRWAASSTCPTHIGG